VDREGTSAEPTSPVEPLTRIFTRLPSWDSASQGPTAASALSTAKILADLRPGRAAGGCRSPATTLD